MRQQLPLLPRRGAHWLGFLALALIMAGCFQAAGSSVEPTSVDLTALATLTQPTATPFITAIPTEPAAATTEPPPPVIQPTEIVVTETPLPPTLPPVEPTQPIQPTTEPATLESAAASGGTGATPQPPAVEPTSTLFLPPTPTALPTDSPCEHTVQQGEWFYSIARKYNLDPQLLINANPRLSPNRLQPGDKLIIPNCTPTGAAPAQPTQPADASAVQPTEPPPPGATTPAPTPIMVTETTYTVVEGDTLGGIARRYGVTVDDIKRANNLQDDFLRVGQRLVIPVAPGN